METINLNPAPAPVAPPASAPPQVVVVSNSKGGNTIYIVIIAILLIMGGVYFVMNRRPPVPDDLPVPVGPTPDQIAPVEPEGDENIEVEALDDTAETKEKEVEFKTGTPPSPETKENEVKFITGAPPPTEPSDPAPPPTEPSDPAPPPTETSTKNSLDDLKPKVEFVTTTEEPTEESTMLNIRERVIFVTPTKNEKAVEEIRMGNAQGVVQEIQQVSEKKGVSQEIQQVGGGSPLQKEANEAVVRLEELMAGGPPDARYPPTEKDIRDARNEAENAIAAAVATGGYNPYDITKSKMGMKKQLSGQTVQEIQQVGGGVSQGIQQIPKKKGVVQEIQQVGGGVSQGIQQIPKKKGVVQEIQQVGMARGFL
jgi:hypothetical protein